MRSYWMSKWVIQTGEGAIATSQEQGTIRVAWVF